MSAALVSGVAGAGERDATIVHYEPRVPPPEVGRAYPDPVFGTELLRLTDVQAWDMERAGPEYSQLQAWSADGRYLLLGGYLIVDPRQREIVHEIDFGVPGHGGAFRWSPTEADTLYYTWAAGAGCGGGALMRYRLHARPGRPATREIVRCFPEYESLDRQRSHEELSNDGDRIALVGNRRDGRREIFAYELSTDIKYSPLLAETDIDWVGISPSGRYVVVLWAGGGVPRGWGMEAFDLDMNYVGKIHTGTGHSDLVQDEDGTEWAVVDNANNAYLLSSDHFIVKARIPDGVVIADGQVDRDASLASGATVPLLRLAWEIGLHVSCRNIHAPQWCVITAEGGPSPRAPFQDEIFLLRLDSHESAPKVDRLAHHRSLLASYWETPFATSKQDGTEILFATTWRGATGIDGYLISVDSDAGFPEPESMPEPAEPPANVP